METRMARACTWLTLTLNWSCNILALWSHMLTSKSFLLTLLSASMRLYTVMLKKTITMIQIRSNVRSQSLMAWMNPLLLPICSFNLTATEWCCWVWLCCVFKPITTNLSLLTLLLFLLLLLHVSLTPTSYLS